MGDEYWIVRDSNKKTLFLLSEHTDKEFDLGDLSRRAFSYLGDWKLFMNQNGYGMAYRLGVKSGFTDNEGDPMEFYIQFGLPVSRKNHELTQEEVEKAYDALKTVTKTASALWGLTHPNLRVIAAIAKPPEYMVKELEDLL